MKTREEMLEVNRKQAEFYDSIQHAEESGRRDGYAANRAANLFTRVWSNLRSRQKDAIRRSGLRDKVHAIHLEWVDQREGGDFLEIGCFNGTRMTMHLLEIGSSYKGIDLSAKAVEALKAKIADRKLEHKAEVEACDFLEMESDREFDLIYTQGVLHHFENPEPVFAKIASLLKPDGVLLFLDPSTINPFYRGVRKIYRPFQSDAPWEWPFTQGTVDAMKRHFEFAQLLGYGRWSLPFGVLAAVPLLGGISFRIYEALSTRELQGASRDRVWHNSVVTGLCKAKG